MLPSQTKLFPWKQFIVSEISKIFKINVIWLYLFIVNYYFTKSYNYLKFKMYLEFIEFKSSENMLWLGNKTYWLQHWTSYIPIYYPAHMVCQKLKEIVQFLFGFLGCYFFLKYFWFYISLWYIISHKNHIFGNFNLI